MFLPGETRSIIHAVLSLTQVKFSRLLTGPPLNYSSTEMTVHQYPFYFFFFFFFFFLLLFFCFSMFVYSLVLEAILSPCLPFSEFRYLVCTHFVGPLGRRPVRRKTCTNKRQDKHNKCIHIFMAQLRSETTMLCFKLLMSLPA